MKAKKQLISVIIVVIFSLITNETLIGQKSSIDIDKLKANDKNWFIVSSKIENETKEVRYKSHKWLMYFIHWWKLNDENKNISKAYAKELLQNLWGMQFKLNDKTGECKVNGHKAFYAEAMLRNAVKSCFIVWNCEETQRQFVADCNINLLMKTPEKLFELQTSKITPNICCHGSNQTKNIQGLSQRVNYKKINISYFLPKDWRSSKFLLTKDSTKKTPGYYPLGVNKDKGSIWNLLTNSEKQIHFINGIMDKELSKAKLFDLISKIENDTVIEYMDTIKYLSIYKNFKLDHCKQNKDTIECDGIFEVEQEVPAYKSKETIKYIFYTRLWKEKNEFYFMLASMIAYEDIWRIKFDLSPSKEVFNVFIDNLKASLN